MEFVFTPWKGRLIEDLRSAQREVLLVCPYITKVIAEEIFGALANRGVEVRTVSRFERAEFIAGSSDLDAHYALSGTSGARELSRSFELRCLSKVHAKMFLIDGRIAYVGSSNLTFSGLLRNYEGTVRIVGEENVAPLRREILEVWPRLRRVERQDFVDMLGKLHGSAQTRATRVAAEHFYDIHSPIDGVEVTVAGEELRRAVNETTAASRPGPTNESVPIPSTDELVFESLGIGAPASEVGPEVVKQEALPVRPVIDVVQEHAVIVKRFLDILRDRFGIDVGRNPTGYARALMTRACVGIWNDDLVGKVDFGPVDAQSLYQDNDDHNSEIGVKVYELCVAHVSVKSGILSAFGTEFASHFRQHTLKDAVLRSTWRHNFLGPLLYRNNAERDNERFALNAVRVSTFRLFAVMLLHEGLHRVLELYEEFCNPVDILGTDAVSVIEFEAAKTTLQNLAQRHNWKLPSYPTATPEGTQNAVVWNGHAQMLGLSATAKAPRQKEAENFAAAQLLRLISRSPKWGQFVQDYRAEQLDKAGKQHQPLFPRVEIGPEKAHALTQVFQATFGLNIKPSLGFVALLDTETRRSMGLPWSNATMSWFGSFVLNLLITLVSDDRSKQDSPTLRKALFERFGTEELRQAAGISVGRVEGDHTVVIVNALCCALYFSNSFEAFSDKLKPIIVQSLGTIPKQKALDPLDRMAFIELVKNFNPAVGYARYAQEITQATLDRTTPAYAVIDVITSPPGREDAVAVRCTWRDYAIVTRARNKVIARNKAAHALCERLVADDQVWKEIEAGASAVELAPQKRGSVHDA